jgi:hypothetical protein
LVFPAVAAGLLWMACRARRKWIVPAGFVVMFAASLWLCFWLVFSETTAVFLGVVAGRLSFFLMPARAWQLGVGVLLAWWMTSRPSWQLGPGAGALGIALTLFSFVRLDDLTPYPSLLTFVPTLGAALVVAAPGSLRWLESSALVRMGDASYSWYLWHWPAIVFARAVGIDSPPLLAAVGLASWPLAAWSYENIENRYRWTLAERRAGWAIALAVSVLVAFGAQQVATYALAEVLPQADAIASVQASLRNHIDLRCESVELATGVSGCVLGTGVARLALVGDSNAGHYAEAVLGAGTELGFETSVVTRSACFGLDLVIVDYSKDIGCRPHTRSMRAWLVAERFDVVVVALAADIYLELPGARVTRGELEGQDAYGDALTAFVREVRASGAEVVLAHQAPKFTLDIAPGDGADSCAATVLVLQLGGCYEQMPRTEALARRAEAYDVEREVAAALGVGTGDVFDALCPGDRLRGHRRRPLVPRPRAHLNHGVGGSVTNLR